MIEKLKKLNILYVENISLKDFTTLHIGPMAKLILFPSNESEVHQILSLCHPLILGKGSNVLINDEKEIEVVMVLRDFKKIERVGTVIYAQAGALLMDVCLFALKEGLGGLEFAYGIPGSVGGAVLMNAGAYGGEMKDVICEVKTDQHIYKQKECHFDYRHSIFSENHECILLAGFQLKEKNRELIEMKMQELIDKRRQKQPLDQYSAGSTFKRGNDFYASQLINECHLKGYHVNDAQVSTKHAGFLINKKEASFRDFMELIKQVQKIVYEKTQKNLECEVKIIGGEDDLCQ